MFDGALLKDAKHIHFIGVGGSGMFPIVEILLAQGFPVRTITRATPSRSSGPWESTFFRWDNAPKTSPALT